jgi:hypothetical protein
VFTPVPGGWGRSGRTRVLLSAADKSTIKDALAIAWENVAAESSAKRHKARATRAAGTAKRKS